MSRQRPVNRIKFQFPAKSVNEGLARAVVAAFAAQLDPTLSQLADIKTSVSEAVTNCIVHAYPDMDGDVYITCESDRGGRLRIRIKDTGVGIDNVKQAMEPLFTTSPETERSGMGFTVMQSFCDGLKVRSVKGKGTTVTLIKNTGSEK